MLPLSQATVRTICLPSAQDREEDKMPVKQAREDLFNTLRKDNQPFFIDHFRSIGDLFEDYFIKELNPGDLCNLREVSKTTLEIADNLLVQREVICENWGFGIKNWNQYLGEVVEQPLPLKWFERLFQQMKEDDLYSKVSVKSVFENYLLYFVPKIANQNELNLPLLQQLVNAPREGKKIAMQLSRSLFQCNDQAFVHQSIEQSRWILMRKEIETGERKKLIWRGMKFGYSPEIQLKDVLEGDRVGSALEIAVGLLTYRMKYQVMLHWEGRYYVQSNCAVNIGDHCTDHVILGQASILGGGIFLVGLQGGNCSFGILPILD